MDQVKGGVSPMKRRGQILWGIRGENGGLVLLFTLVLGVCPGMFVPFFGRRWAVRLFCFVFVSFLVCLFFFSLFTFIWVVALHFEMQHE